MSGFTLTESRFGVIKIKVVINEERFLDRNEVWTWGFNIAS